MASLFARAPVRRATGDAAHVRAQNSNSKIERTRLAFTFTFSIPCYVKAATQFRNQCFFVVYFLCCFVVIQFLYFGLMLKLSDSYKGK